MDDRPYRTASIGGIERPDGWSPLRRELGVESFGINAWTAHEEGEAVIPEHDEVPSGHEELYLVTAGAAAFTVAGEEVDVGPGEAILVPDPAVKRSAVAREAGTTVLVVGAKPGHPYSPRAWEVNAEVFKLLDAGQNAEARELLVGAFDRYPDANDQAVLHYNLACTESQLGNPQEALGHLEQAIAARPSLAEGAREDSDLDPIRDEPRFAEIVG
jgi:tetratricopeptide (TPR) repeat protein